MAQMTGTFEAAPWDTQGKNNGSVLPPGGCMRPAHQLYTQAPLPRRLYLRGLVENKAKVGDDFWIRRFCFSQI